MEVWSVHQLRRLYDDKGRKLWWNKAFQKHLYPKFVECAIELTIHSSFHSQEADEFDVRHYLERALGDIPDVVKLSAALQCH